MRLTTFIAEGDPHARSFVRRELSVERDIEVLGEADRGYEAVERIRSIRPDILVLDVQLPGMSGFDVLCAVEEECAPAVLLTSPSEAHAVKAFEFGAAAYLLKPLDRQRLAGALQKVRAQALCRNTSRLAKQVSSLADELRWRREPPAKILVRVAGRMVFVNLADVDWISAEGNYAHLHVGERSYTLRETLSSLESRLGPEFLRIHRSSIINLNRITEVHSLFKGDYLVVLSDGTRLSSSRAYRPALQRLLRLAS